MRSEKPEINVSQGTFQYEVKNNIKEISQWSP